MDAVNESTLVVTAGEWSLAPNSARLSSEGIMYADTNLIDADILGSGIALRDAPTLRDIQKLSAVLGLYPQETLEPKHHFAKGMYGRELLMKAGTLIVGKIHKHEHLAIMVYGDITVYTEREGKQRFKGYNMMVSPPETKRVVYPHADTLWVTIHASESQDLEQLERELITPEDNEAIEAFARQYLDELRGIAA